MNEIGLRRRSKEKNPEDNVVSLGSPLTNEIREAQSQRLEWFPKDDAHRAEALVRLQKGLHHKIFKASHGTHLTLREFLITIKLGRFSSKIPMKETSQRAELHEGIQVS
jgi:hypothetical protein